VVKRTLKYGSIEIKSAGRLFFKEDHYSLLKFIDEFYSVSSAVSSMTEERWKLLFSILKTLACHYDINYCVYENPYGLLFDIGSQTIENKDFPALRDGFMTEARLGQLQRLKNERDHIENEISNLQEKHIEVCKRIKKLGFESECHRIAVFIGRD
jgi:hypothetical protein